MTERFNRLGAILCFCVCLSRCDCPGEHGLSFIICTCLRGKDLSPDIYVESKSVSVWTAAGWSNWGKQSAQGMKK